MKASNQQDSSDFVGDTWDEAQTAAAVLASNSSNLLTGCLATGSRPITASICYWQVGDVSGGNGNDTPGVTMHLPFSPNHPLPQAGWFEKIAKRGKAEPVLPDLVTVNSCGILSCCLSEACVHFSVSKFPQHANREENKKSEANGRKGYCKKKKKRQYEYFIILKCKYSLWLSALNIGIFFQFYNWIKLSELLNDWYFLCLWSAQDYTL